MFGGISREKVGWGIVVVVLVLVSVFLGVTYPLPQAPDGGSRAVTDRYYESVRAGKALTVDGTTTLGTALTFGEVAVSGPYRYGSASSVVSGTLIAHGLATTPTLVVLTAGQPITTPLFVTARNATSVTVGINDGLTVGTVFWLAGK